MVVLVLKHLCSRIFPLTTLPGNKGQPHAPGFDPTWTANKARHQGKHTSSTTQEDTYPKNTRSIKVHSTVFVCECILHSSPLAEVLLARLLHLVPLVFQRLTGACNVISALIQEGQGGRISVDKNSNWPEALCTSQQVAT